MTHVTVWAEPDLWEVFEDDVELLAIADAIAVTQPKPQRHLPGRRFALGVSAAAAAIALISMLAPRQLDPGGNGIIDRALAAVGQGPVLHAVIRFERSPADERPAIDVETWYDQQTREVHFIVRDRTRILDDVLIRSDGTAVSLKGPVPGSPVRNRLDPALEVFLTGYIPALRDGRARETGAGVVAGEAVNWIEIPLEGKGDSERIAVDSQTGKPLLVLQLSRGEEVARYRILTLELRARMADDFTHPSNNKSGG